MAHLLWTRLSGVPPVDAALERASLGRGSRGMPPMDVALGACLPWMWLSECASLGRGSRSVPPVDTALGACLPWTRLSGRASLGRGSHGVPPVNTADALPPSNQLLRFPARPWTLLTVQPPDWQFPLGRVQCGARLPRTPSAESCPSVACSADVTLVGLNASPTTAHEHHWPCLLGLALVPTPPPRWLCARCQPHTSIGTQRRSERETQRCTHSETRTQR